MQQAASAATIPAPSPVLGAQQHLQAQPPLQLPAPLLQLQTPLQCRVPLAQVWLSWAICMRLALALKVRLVSSNRTSTSKAYWCALVRLGYIHMFNI